MSRSPSFDSFTPTNIQLVLFNIYSWTFIASKWLPVLVWCMYAPQTFAYGFVPSSWSRSKRLRSIIRIVHRIPKMVPFSIQFVSIRCVTLAKCSEHIRARFPNGNRSIWMFAVICRPSRMIICRKLSRALCVPPPKLCRVLPLHIWPIHRLNHHPHLQHQPPQTLPTRWWCAN